MDDFGIRLETSSHHIGTNVASDGLGQLILVEKANDRGRLAPYSAEGSMKCTWTAKVVALSGKTTRYGIEWALFGHASSAGSLPDDLSQLRRARYSLGYSAFISAFLFRYILSTFFVFCYCIQSYIKLMKIFSHDKNVHYLLLKLTFMKLLI